MLGDIAPRAAAKTKRGREKLVAWLKFLEIRPAAVLKHQSRARRFLPVIIASTRFSLCPTLATGTPKMCATTSAAVMLASRPCSSQITLNSWQAILDKMAASSTHRLGRGNPTAEIVTRKRSQPRCCGTVLPPMAPFSRSGGGKLLAGGRWPMVAHGCRTTGGVVRCWS